MKGKKVNNNAFYTFQIIGHLKGRFNPRSSKCIK